MSATAIDKLNKEIEDIEKQLAANPFGGLFDKQRMEKLRKKLKKKRKELAALEAETAKPAKKKKTK